MTMMKVMILSLKLDSDDIDKHNDLDSTKRLRKLESGPKRKRGQAREGHQPHENNLCEHGTVVKSRGHQPGRDSQT